MKKIIIFIFILFVIVGCSKREVSYSKLSEESGSSSYSSDDYNDKTDNFEKDVTDKKIKENINNANNENNQTNNSVKAERKLIRNGTINYDVNDLTNIDKNITLKVKEFGGYVAQSNFSSYSGNMVLKIPFDKFDSFLLICGNFGKITTKNINVEDVTQKFYDMEGRIKNKRILQQRLQNYLLQAKNVEELIKIEYELNNVTNELESIESNFKTLSNLISYSTLNLNFYIPGKSDVYRVFPSFKEGFKNFFYNIADFFYGLFFILLYIVIFGIPLLLIIGILYLITFGKIGIVKKFFKGLSTKKSIKTEKE